MKDSDTRRLRAEWDVHRREAIDEIVRQFLEDAKEFGLTTEFLREKCRVCGDGRKTHRDIMRERGLSGKHEQCAEFLVEHINNLGKRWAQRERWKFWKRPPFRCKMTEAEKEARARELRPIIRALHPDDWKKFMDIIRRQGD